MKLAKTKLPIMPKLLTTKQTAAYLGLSSPGTLEVWRTTKRYPLTYIKVGRLVRYRLEDIEKFLVEYRVGGNKEEV